MKSNLNGWIILDKPTGITSAKAVAIVKRLTNTKKIGHAGTLDPDASGVLPLALGEATKTMQFMVDGDKTYRFTVLFGLATDTDDATGKIIENSEIIPTEAEIIAALPYFTGNIEQIPPAYSAIKVNGKRSYDLARNGEIIELKSRQVTIHELKLLKMPSDNMAEFEMTCSKGTYVRSIARDLAKKLKSCGHVCALRRTKVNNFCEEDAISLEKLETLVHNIPLSGELDISPNFSNRLREGNKQEGLEKHWLLPVKAALDDIPVIDLDFSSSECLKKGQSVFLPDIFTKEAIICASFENKLVAIGQLKENTLKPMRVFNY